MKFVRREVKEKGAEWGELRRIKKRTIATKGLPHIPDFILQSDEGLSYLAIIFWRRELRLYLFDNEGSIIHGESYSQNISSTYEELSKKSKKVARYPPQETPLTQAQKDQHYDKQFKVIWSKIAKLLRIPPKNRRNRPLIRLAKQDGTGIFGSYIGEKFIFIPHNNLNLQLIFTYYSFYFFIPSQFREDNEIGEALTFTLVKSIRKFQFEPFPKERKSYEIFKNLTLWTSLKLLEILRFLNKISMYYDKPFNKVEFLALTNLELNYIKRISRKSLPDLFCFLYSESANNDFLFLSNILGLPLEFNCTLPNHLENDFPFIIYHWLNSHDFGKLFDYIHENNIQLSKGLRKALEEALNYQYTNVLKINTISSDSNSLEIFNLSDIPILLISAIKILSNGAEEIQNFQEIIISPKSAFLLDLNDLRLPVQNPIRFQYILVKSTENIDQPLFRGTLIL